MTVSGLRSPTSGPCANAPRHSHGWISKRNGIVTVLVIGGNARLGRRVAAALGSSRVVVREATGNPGAVVVKDYRDIDDAAFDGVSSVINCVGSPVGGDDVLRQINIAVPVNAARRARDAGCRQFIQLGSLSVYGRAEWIDDTTVAAPLSPYGRSKYAADLALLALATPAFAVTVLRAPALYGVGASGKFGALARLIRRTGLCPVLRAQPRRSALHLDNAAMALVALCSRATPRSGVEFAQDHHPFDLDQLAAAVRQASGRRVRPVRLPDAVLGGIRAAAPALHASLFASSLIDPAAAMTTEMALPVSLLAGLAEMLADEWQTR